MQDVRYQKGLVSASCSETPLDKTWSIMPSKSFLDSHWMERPDTYQNETKQPQSSQHPCIWDEWCLSSFVCVDLPYNETQQPSNRLLQRYPPSSGLFCWAFVSCHLKWKNVYFLGNHILRNSKQGREVLPQWGDFIKRLFNVIDNLHPGSRNGTDQ